MHLLIMMTMMMLTFITKTINHSTINQIITHFRTINRCKLNSNKVLNSYLNNFNNAKS